MHMYVQVGLYVCICMHVTYSICPIYVYTHVCMHACMRALVYVCINVYMGTQSPLYISTLIVAPACVFSHAVHFWWRTVTFWCRTITNCWCDGCC